ncbi:hypothetical protein Back11_42230 [Paenibacillus baekrokdamisoli]|uniref:Uncharacterized protein n=1 Tax=Paenibacillus baekrokdamisoli TaxID=1712516 RepID=A0A3G9JFN8_9BACL|nr:hypothetical protein [Paenibacillus baekrokdamisoli]MBB3068078.1 hypothetical protein [Paenibacillus baekrokdamisoli]BBH22878.1 hypothetical protein Back11_42230 [Paenibacillus baekrokdamisoli]
MAIIGVITIITFTVIVLLGLRLNIMKITQTEDTIEQRIGVRDTSLSYDRLIDLEWEWNRSLNSRLQVELQEASLIARSELPEQPETVVDLLIEIASMYRGDSPFTYARMVALEYYTEQEPIASEIAPFGPLPITDFLEIDVDDQEAQLQNIQESYKEFNQYVDNFMNVKFKQ